MPHFAEQGKAYFLRQCGIGGVPQWRCYRKKPSWNLRGAFVDVEEDLFGLSLFLLRWKRGEFDCGGGMMEYYSL